MIELKDLIGAAAATLTTVAFIPQALKTFRTRDVSGISLGMYALFVTGLALWLAYGILQQDWPVIAANAVTLALAGAVLLMKLRYR